MRVVYKPYIVTAMVGEINKADRLGRKIEKFVLTGEERDQLERETGFSTINTYNRAGKITTFYDICVEVQ